MKFICTKENIHHALQLVSPIAGKHTNLPILNNVMIEATDSGVTLTTTNLEVAMRVTVRAKVDAVGVFTVPAKVLSDYIHLLSHEQVEIEKKENELVIQAGGSSTKIKGSPSDDFPVVPAVNETHAYVVDAKGFRDGLVTTVLAAAKNDIRPELAGLYMGLNTDRFKGVIFAATDSYRLAEKKIAVGQGSDQIQVIIPGRTVLEMARVLGVANDDNAEKSIRLWVGDNQVAIRYQDFELTSRVVDGKYPDYAQIIPATFKTTAIISIPVFVNAIKAASLFAATGINAIALDFNAHNQTVSVSSTSTQAGEHTASIDADVQGEENSILLNFRYLLDGLQHLDGDIEFCLNSSDAPCLVRQKGKDDSLYIVMPIRQ